MKRDVLLICAILLAVCGFSLANRVLYSEPGAKVEIAVIENDSSKTILETFDLSENTAYTISTESQGINHLIIQDGKVWISEANCPNQDCIKQGKISMNGEMLVCLPHRITVSITEK
ncbi:MAG: NusG domain II-containing protein [Lachnoclostridium sp.]|nr:NusG domain II-containing protein [Lachnoclostridium sp.]